MKPESNQEQKNQQEKKENTAKDSSAKLYLIGLAIAVLIVPLFYILFNNHALIGSEPYYHIRLAEYAKNLNSYNNLNLENKDSMVYGQRHIFFNLLHPILGLLSYVIPITYAYQIIGVICAISSILLIYRIMELLGIKGIGAHKDLGPNKAGIYNFTGAYKRFNNLIVYTLLFFITSPLFIYLFTVSVSNGLAIMLTLLGTYFFILSYEPRYSKIRKTASFFILLMTAMFSIFNAILSVSLILAYSISKKRGYKAAIAFSAVILIVALSLGQEFFYNFNYNYGEKVFIKESLTSFGGMTGFSIFVILFLVIGFIISWNEKGKYGWAYLILMLMLIASYFFSSGINMYSNIIMCFFAAIGFYSLVNLKWELSFVKFLTVTTILCILLFSSISYTKDIIKESPNEDLIKSLILLSYIKESRGIAISSIENGFLIESLSGIPAFMDPLSIYSKDFNNELKEFKNILNEQKLSSLVDKFNRYNISYVIIDGKMKNDIWGNSQSGLNTLVNNGETFKKEYSLNQVDIFRFIGKNYNKQALPSANNSRTTVQ